MNAASWTSQRHCVQSREIYPKRRHVFTRTDDVTCQQTVITTLAADRHRTDGIRSLFWAKTPNESERWKKIKSRQRWARCTDIRSKDGLEQGAWECCAALWCRVIQDHRKYGPAEALLSHTNIIRYTTDWGRTWRQKYELIATLDNDK